MLKKNKPSVTSVDFQDIRKFKKRVVLGGEVIAVLQNIMVDRVGEPKLMVKLIQETSPESVHKAFNLITELQGDLYDFLELDKPEMTTVEVKTRRK